MKVCSLVAGVCAALFRKDMAPHLLVFDCAGIKQAAGIPAKWFIHMWDYVI